MSCANYHTNHITKMIYTSWHMIYIYIYISGIDMYICMYVCRIYIYISGILVLCQVPLSTVIFSCNKRRTFIGIRRKTKRPSKVAIGSFHGMRTQSLSLCFAFTFSRKCQYTIFRTFDLDFVLGKTRYVNIKDMRLGGFAYICVTLSSVYVVSAEEKKSRKS